MKYTVRSNQNPTNLSDDEIKHLITIQFMMDHLGIADFLDDDILKKIGYPDAYMSILSIDLTSCFHPKEIDLELINNWQEMKEVAFLFSKYGESGILAWVCLRRDYRVNDFLDYWKENKVAIVKAIIKNIKKNHTDIIKWATL